ncbi:hypothetical protein HY440_01295 [Candidatus Microgenomates bacterium]|nr:hypothetical protein [Candidatus Microgenomates bacterium]
MSKAHHLIRHGADFFLLTLILAFGLGGLLYFRFETASQIAVVVLMAVFYVLWGILHHHHDGDLTAKVVLEYISMSSLITFILVIFLLRV